MTDKQKNYIKYLTARLLKVIDKAHPSYAHLQYGLNAKFTRQQASEWISHLKDMILVHNGVIATYSIDGGKSRKGQI